MVYKEIKLIGSEKIFAGLNNTSLFILVLGALATIFNFIILSFYDKLGLLYLKKKLSFLKTLKISALSFAVSNLAGHTYASGGAIRYLFLRPLGFKKKEILLLVTLISLFSIFGLLGTLFLALLHPIFNIIPPIKPFFFLFCAKNMSKNDRIVLIFLCIFYREKRRSRNGFAVFFVVMP